MIMKKIKRLFAFGLALIMCLGMAVTASAADVDSKQNGSASITINNASKSETYTFYKVFDAKVGEGATDAPITYYVDEANAVLANAVETSEVFEETVNGIAVKDGKEIDDITAEIKSWIDTGTISETFHCEGNGGSMTVTNLPYGYYYITSGLGSVVTVNSTNPNATVYDKNDSEPVWPPVDPDDPNGPKGKVIMVDGEAVEDATVSIGEEVEYQIHVKTVNFVQDAVNTKQVGSYIVKDTAASGITITEITSVKVGNKEVLPKDDDTNPNGYILGNTPIASGFEITVPWVSGPNNESIYDNGSILVITYKAVLNEKAGETNKNEAKFSWTDLDGAPTENPDPDDSTAHTFSFGLVKTNKENAVLSGANFELYDVNPDLDENVNAVPIALVAENSGYRVATDEDTDTTTTIEAGNITIRGLAGNLTEGQMKSYWLKETKAPDGYNLVTAATEVKIGNASNPATVTENVYVQGGVEVENLAGSTLPSTGGIGTTIFYVVGGVLVAGAGILLITKKRMKKEQ